MFAQAAAELPMGAILQIAGPLGVGGILAWFMWYTVSVAMPKKDEAYAKSLDVITDKHAKALSDMQSQYLRERTEWRTDFRDAIEQKTNSINTLAAATHELIVAVKELTARTERVKHD